MNIKPTKTSKHDRNLIGDLKFRDDVSFESRYRWIMRNYDEQYLERTIDINIPSFLNNLLDNGVDPEFIDIDISGRLHILMQVYDNMDFDDSKIKDLFAFIIQRRKKLPTTFIKAVNNLTQHDINSRAYENNQQFARYVDDLKNYLRKIICEEYPEFNFTYMSNNEVLKIFSLQKLETTGTFSIPDLEKLFTSYYNDAERTGSNEKLKSILYLFKESKAFINTIYRFNWTDEKATDIISRSMVEIITPELYRTYIQRSKEILMVNVTKRRKESKRSRPLPLKAKGTVTNNVYYKHEIDEMLEPRNARSSEVFEAFFGMNFLEMVRQRNEDLWKQIMSIYMEFELSNHKGDN